MEQMRLHHVGIVLPTLKQAHDFIDRFGLEIDYEGFVDAYHADLIFTKKSTFGSPLEFIIPKEGVLCDFNNGKGGIAHIAFEVEDVEKVRKEFEEKGMGMLEDKAVPGTDDIIVNFLRPRFNDGILVEFVETVAPIKRD
ncbi:VOC family protein [Peptoniphilus stercorisuis]|uniref:Lactoylglutathione lyase/methylmalonyl-CoA/ethylmalonyl-CoA epimerase n=1 Tax=Peptoniphilus stercorisuis TaxID=1436965 RepID=A0ABS4KE57_9FIRM|nr:VOC family protein [Peptoniphilus stercorisuis]MBP2026042.1 lactoylglutathione lyase/methylmalonyl-CoA/ethylmalonyl-CoA epimerase [Peptoniphilus stercorisuis]